MPITILGKLVSLLAGMAGLLLISFVIATVGQTLYPTKFEENALNFIAMEKVRECNTQADTCRATNTELHILILTHLHCFICF
jgi:hypothetical protein